MGGGIHHILNRRIILNDVAGLDGRGHRDSVGGVAYLAVGTSVARQIEELVLWLRVCR